MATYSKNGKRIGRPPGRGRSQPVAATRGRWIERQQLFMAGAVPLRADGQRSFSKAKQRLFFDALAETFNITAAAKLAGINRNTVALWRRHNADFRSAFDEVLTEGFIDAKAKLLALALDGTRRRETVLRIGEDRIEKTVEADAGTLLLGIVRLHLAEAAAANALQAEALAEAGRPSDIQLSEWLRADIEAAEAQWALEQAGGAGD